MVGCFHRIYFQSSVVVVVRLGFFIICNASGRLSIVTNRETGSLFTQEPISEIKTTNLAAADMQTLSNRHVNIALYTRKSDHKRNGMSFPSSQMLIGCVGNPSSFFGTRGSWYQVRIKTPKCLPIRFPPKKTKQKNKRNTTRALTPFELKHTRDNTYTSIFLPPPKLPCSQSGTLSS